jgi:hypothetical protein
MRGNPHIAPRGAQPASKLTASHIGPGFDLVVPGIGKLKSVCPRRILEKLRGADERCWASRLTSLQNPRPPATMNPISRTINARPVDLVENTVAQGEPDSRPARRGVAPIPSFALLVQDGGILVQPGASPPSPICSRSVLCHLSALFGRGWRLGSRQLSAISYQQVEGRDASRPARMRRDSRMPAA